MMMFSIKNSCVTKGVLDNWFVLLLFGFVLFIFFVLFLINLLTSPKYPSLELVQACWSWQRAFPSNQTPSRLEPRFRFRFGLVRDWIIILCFFLFHDIAELIILYIKLDVFEPPVLHDLRDRNPGLRVCIEKTGKESSERRWEPSWALKFSPVNLLVHGHDVLVVKGQIPSHQNEEYNPTRLDDDLGGLVALPAENLGGNVSRCAAERVEEAVLVLWNYLPKLIGK